MTISDNNNECSTEIIAILDTDTHLYSTCENPKTYTGMPVVSLILCKNQQVNITLPNGVVVRSGNNTYTLTNKIPLDHEYDDIPTNVSIPLTTTLPKGTGVKMFYTSIPIFEDMEVKLPSKFEVDIPTASILVDRVAKTYFITHQLMKVCLEGTSERVDGKEGIINVVGGVIKIVEPVTPSTSGKAFTPVTPPTSGTVFIPIMSSSYNDSWDDDN